MDLNNLTNFIKENKKRSSSIEEVIWERSLCNFIKRNLHIFDGNN